MVDYTEYKPKCRKPPVNDRISHRDFHVKPDMKKPASGISCDDCIDDYYRCTWGSSDENKVWGKECEQIIKMGCCPRKCTIFRTNTELKYAIESKRSLIQNELDKLKKLENDLK
ncbi:MAG: hypothetical protein WC433_07360 [Candidatus Omnitrophota bacterium]|jgi:hypothetical protein